MDNESSSKQMMGLFHSNKTSISPSRSLTEAPTYQNLETALNSNNHDDRNPLTNLKEIGDTLIGEDTFMGIDYIEFEFPISGVARNPEVSWKQSPSNASIYGRWKTWLPLNPDWSQAGARMTACITSSSRECKVGFNPSTVLYGPKSGPLASLDSVIALLDKIYDVVIPKQVKAIVPLEECLISRLDVTVDVPYVDDPERLYRWVIRHPHSSQAKYDYWIKSGRPRGVSSLHKSGGLRVYKKDIPSQRIRFEAQPRKKICAKYCPTIGDLEVEILRKLFRHYFRRVGESLSQLENESFVEHLVQTNSQTLIRTCIGESVLIQHGLMSRRCLHSKIRRNLVRNGTIDQIDNWVAKHWS
jgi:hypothetical protein